MSAMVDEGTGRGKCSKITMGEEGCRALRGMFPGHYCRTDEELERIWNEGLFVLDANVLLNFYRYSKKTRDEFLGVLRGAKDRLWIPRQVAEEFFSNRLGAIRDQKKAYAAVRGVLIKARKDLENEMGKMHKDPGIVEAGELRKKAEKVIGELISDAEKLEKEGDFRSFEATYSPDDDEIWSALEEIFEGRVGEGLLEDGMKEVLEAGPRRYESRVPPGYEDGDDKSKPGDRQFGDLILWLETIAEAKRTRKPVLFVTDDRKNDWWDNSVHPPLPHPELGNEMQKQAGVLFHMFLPLDFSKWAGEKLNQRISREAAEEIEELGPREEDEPYIDLFLELTEGLTGYLVNPEKLPQDPRQLDQLIDKLELLKIVIDDMSRASPGDDEDVRNMEGNANLLLRLARTRRRLVEP